MCLLSGYDFISIVNRDDGIFLGPNDHKLSGIIKEIKNIEDQSHSSYYVEATVMKHTNGYLPINPH
jgi:hypothetical protein